ncbi:MULTISPECIES: FAD-dependent oxidoreductase [Bacillus]|uniref:FAD-binding monooxygenase n=2 Tax=Bacillus cereus group TaxID=86661 RepID=A0A2B0XRK7_BACAN|nr:MULTISPECIES: FAD-dependent oxidoreductase [Bacillus]KZD39039.1 FAD-dependent monooxygenase [Bacillus cereus]MBJ8061720.1 FAD-dependent monooxygenase [Bacillus cereus]MCU4759940.1 FAD-dependent monooxygenase [Bacillus cereus]MCU5107382.1 FAD-dependent monooxygenase [Bacillus cereus]MCU5343004.1 FAD-dependent monooxygenase [Bacillus cereus]
MENYYDVAVVGGGPVGLMTACELAIQGINVVVLERRVDRIRNSRALTLHPRSLELMAMRGIENRFLSRGKKLDTSHFAALDTRLNFKNLDTDFPYTLFIPQSITEEILEERALELGVDIKRGHTLKDLKQYETFVQLEIEQRETIYKIEVPYVIGADGARSVVRELSNIPFNGTNTTTTAILGDIILEDIPDTPFLSTSNINGILMMVPIAPDVIRFAIVDPKNQAIPVHVAVTEKEFIDSIYRITGEHIQIKSTLWLSRFGNATKLANTYQHKRVFLAGDAAHIHFPAGGQGLNVGLQDAFNIGWKLGLAIKHKKYESLLKSYHIERHAVGKQFFKEVQAQEQLMINFSNAGMELRELFSHLLTYPEINNDLSERVSGLGVRYSSMHDIERHPLIGKRCTNLTISSQNKKSYKLFELMQDGKFILLIHPSYIDKINKMNIDSHIKVIVGEIQDSKLQNIDTVLIRPDGHIATIEYTKIDNCE